MKAVREGTVSGLLASILLGILFFVDYGPGSALGRVAAWFGLDNPATGRLLGFFLLLVVGSLFGLLFGAWQRTQVVTLAHVLLTGLATGVLFWLLIALLLGTVINHRRLDFGEFLYGFVMLLVYGMLVGSLYYSRVAVNHRKATERTGGEKPREPFSRASVE
ncbi:MAG: hypothetical protein M3Z24_14880 [Chloroflexota bacterium]|nr:hypothetical protein [Chloroflexota bacterium]